MSAWHALLQRPPTSLERGLKSGTVVQVMVAVKLQRRAQAPVRIELTTPGLLDKCSNHCAKAGAHCLCGARGDSVCHLQARFEIRHSCSGDGCRENAERSEERRGGRECRSR